MKLNFLPVVLAAIAVSACQQSSQPSSADPMLGPGAGTANLTWPSYDRPMEDADATLTKEKDIPITMPYDGTILRADVVRPSRDGKFPVIVELTPYNKSGSVAQQYPYLQQRGYIQLTVDVRGTGSSQGTWDSSGELEQRDGYEIIEWAAKQPWSDGNVGMIGPSYMGLMQIFTAGRKPPHLKALFAIVPMADGYRDIVYSGGQTNMSFIPLWLGLVTGTSLIPPAFALDGSPQNLVLGTTTLLQHAADVVAFDVPAVSNAIVGGDMTYDSPYWKLHSPIEVVDNIDVPVFVCGGLHDLFQRGEPMLYERLRNRVTSKLLVGPWTHVTASSGAPLGGGPGVALPVDGVPAYQSIALQWFDQYLKGMNVHADQLPPVTYYNYGPNKFETQADWPLPNLAPTRHYLHKDNLLNTSAPTGDEASDMWLQHPVSGACTQSTGQWTAGAGDALPCTTDDRLNEAGETVFTTPVLDAPLRFQGPINAHLWLSTTASDAVVTVRVTDVDSSGASMELTTGWMAASFRALDPAKSRYVRGELLQPWHPFTKESVLELPSDGSPVEIDVEVFPTNATILPGHQLRIAIGPSDFPHAVPPLPQLANTLGGVVELLHDKDHPSYVTLPTLGSTCVKSGCAALDVPDMVRH